MTVAKTVQIGRKDEAGCSFLPILISYWITNSRWQMMRQSCSRHRPFQVVASLVVGKGGMLWKTRTVNAEINLLSAICRLNRASGESDGTLVALASTGFIREEVRM